MRGSQTSSNRWNARAMRLVTLTCSLVLAATACARHTTVAASASPSAPSSNYIFSNIQVSSSDSPAGTMANVSWDTGWTSEAFPGVRSCAWKVLDASGSVIGQHEDVFIGMSPNAKDTEIEIPVTGTAASAVIECADQRLDLAGTYAYGFSNVQPLVPTADQQLFGVTYDAKWLGDGAPGPVTCQATLLDASGNTVGSGAVNILVASGATQGASAFIGQVPQITDPSLVVGATLHDCHPLTG